MLDLLMMQNARRANSLKFSADLTSTAKVITPDKGTGPATFTGGGQWVSDHEGILRLVDAGNPAVPGCRVVRNLLQQSNTFSVAPWGMSAALITPNAVIAPDGTMTGTLIDGNGSAYTSAQVIGVFNGTDILISCWMKAGTLTSRTLIIRDVTTATNLSAVAATLSTGTLNAPSGGGIATITPAANGWYRVSLLLRGVTAGHTYSYYFGTGSDSGASGNTWHLWHCQVENVTGQSIQTPGEYVTTTVTPVAQCFNTLLDGTPITGIKGVLLEPVVTNKVTGYSVIPADSYAATKTSGTLVIGRKYEIVTTAVDYFGAGKVIGNQFVAASALTCSGTNSVKEVILATGTIATSTSTLAVPGMTLSGDAAATLSVVDDTAALAAAGLQNICSSGKVYKLDNSAAVAFAVVVVAGVAGNTNNHSFSIFTKCAANSGNTFIRFSTTTASSAIVPISTTYQLVKGESKAAVATDSVSIRINQGETVYFTLPQLEELPFATSPIITAGATATRAAAILAEPIANLRSNSIAGGIDWTPTMAASTVRWLWGAYKDASNYFGILRDGAAGTVIFRKRIAGVNYDASYTIAVTPGTTYKVGWRLGAAGVDIFINGVKGTGNANTTDAAVPTAWQLGADGNSANQGTPQLKNLRIYWEDASDAKMISRTT